VTAISGVQQADLSNHNVKNNKKQQQQQNNANSATPIKKNSFAIVTF